MAKDKTCSIPVLIKRVRCYFCGNKLIDKKQQFKHLNVCMTEGIMVLACDSHVELGDGLIHHLNVHQAQNRGGLNAAEIANKN